MKIYPKIFKELRLKKFKTNIMKKRIHTLETLADHELIDKIDENDIYLETYDVIPIKAEKIYRKKEERRKKAALLKKQKQKNEEVLTTTTYFHINHKNPFSIKNETQEFFIQKYKDLLKNQKKELHSRNIKTNSSILSTEKNNSSKNKINTPKINKTLNKSLNKSSLGSENEFYRKYIKNKKKNKKIFLKRENDFMKNHTKNKTQSSTLSYQISTIKTDDDEKEPIIKLKTNNIEYLEQPLELRKKEKLVKLNENIYDYENSRYFESKVTYNDNQTYFSNEFLRPSFTKNDNSYIEKTPIIGMKSNVKEYFENYVGVFKPKKYKKNFKNFSQVYTNSIKNDINRELLMEKKKDMVDINKVEPNPNKWIEDLDSYMNKIVVNYYKNLDGFIYYGKQGAYTTHYNKIRNGDKIFKEGIRLSQRENI